MNYAAFLNPSLRGDDGPDETIFEAIILKFMKTIILVFALLFALPASATSQCPPGTRSNIFWQCVSIPADKTIAKIARYSSVHNACAAYDPTKSANYEKRLNDLLKLRDLWPGEEWRKHQDYPAAFAKANKRTQAMKPKALALECHRFLTEK
jgi:hypothetical protein